MKHYYDKRDILSEPLFMRLSTRTARILFKAGIDRVEELVRRNPDHILEMAGVGEKRLEDMERLLHDLGLSWGTNISYEEESPLPKSVDNFLRRVASNRWFERGKRYFEQGRVLECEPTEVSSFQEADIFKARVEGSDYYQIYLDVPAQDYDCSCPVNEQWRRWGGACKHVIATTLELACRIREEQLTSGEVSTNWESLARSLGQEPGSSRAQSPFSYVLIEHQQRINIAPVRKSDGKLNEISLNSVESTDLSLCPEDRLILARLETITGRGNRASVEQGNRALGDVLRMLTDRDVYYRKKQADPTPIAVCEEPAELQFMFGTAPDSGYEFTPFINTPAVDTKENSPGRIILREPPWFLTEDKKMFPVEAGPVSRKLLDYTNGDSFTVPEKEAASFARSILPLFHKSETSLYVEKGIRQGKQVPPEGRLELEEKHQQLLLRFRVQYNSTPVEPGRAGELLVYDEARKKFAAVKRDPEAETELQKQFEESGVEPSSRYKDYYRVSGEPLEWLAEELPQLTKDNFQVYGEESLTQFKRPQQMTKSEVVVRGNINWFDLDGEIEFEDESVPLSEIRSAVMEGDRFVPLGDGKRGAIPRKWLNRWGELFEWSKPRGDVLEVPRASASWIDQFTEEIDETRVDDAYRETLERLEATPELEPVETPVGFEGTLRPYQEEGLAWLSYLNETGLGALLADDMGLGKTIQVLALFQHRFNEAGEYPHTLVVCPRSVLRNWEREAARFVPDLEVYRHHGTDRSDQLEDWPNPDLVLTTYGTLLRDIETVSKRNFDIVVLDESHRIRNPHTKRAKAARSLEADHRICLTGTPVQNTTMDLWSQFQFLNPGFLGTRKGFKRALARPIEASGDQEANRTLQKFIQPFVHRRTKLEVAEELPPLSEMKVDCEMAEAQRRAYEETLNQYQRMLSESLEEKGVEDSRFLVFKGLTRLRQICCHPELAERDETVSAKCEMFEEKAAEAIRNDHRVLVFSQFVQFLGKLIPIAEEQGWEYEYLDGQTRNRLERVDRFQDNEDIPLFFVSLKAGGEGLNLTGADLVFLMDPWWNPAVEQQAADRTHRIGQDKHVFVYRFLCPNTVEDKIMSLKQRKKKVEKNLLEPEAGLFRSLDEKDLESLFDLSPVGSHVSSGRR